jgi:hypothetical protein
MTDDRPDPIDDLLRSGAGAFSPAPTPGAAQLASVVRSSRRRDLRGRGAILVGSSALVAGSVALALRDGDEQVESAGPTSTTTSAPTSDAAAAWGLSPAAWDLVCGVGVPDVPVSNDAAYVVGVWSTTGEVPGRFLAIPEPIPAFAPDEPESMASESGQTTTSVESSTALLMGWLTEDGTAPHLVGEDGVAQLVTILAGHDPAAADPSFVEGSRVAVITGSPFEGEVPVPDGLAVVPDESTEGDTLMVTAAATVRELLDLAEACENPAVVPPTTGDTPTTDPSTTGPPTTDAPTTVPEDPGPPCQAPDAAGNGSIGIWVSNQSFAEPTVELEVRLDGDLVAQDTYEVEGQHTWIHYEVELGPSIDQHELVVTSPYGDTVELGVEPGNGVVIDYWGGEPADISTEDVSITVVPDCTQVAFA